MVFHVGSEVWLLASCYGFRRQRKGGVQHRWWFMAFSGNSIWFMQRSRHFRAINGSCTVLSGLPWNVCLLYLDDIIVHGRTFSEQLENLQKVFTCLRKANLKLSPEKCNLIRREVQYLGHIISSKGVVTDPAKINSVKDWPGPTCLAEMKSFLGLCSYYRKFIRNFAEIANPLTRLTQKDVQFAWDSEAENAFQQLKSLLTNIPVLSFLSDEGNFDIGHRCKRCRNWGCSITKTGQRRKSHRIFQSFT